MSSIDAIEPAFAALDACNGALGALDNSCCDPGKSPRLAELGATLTEARVKLRAVTVHPETAGPAASQVLEDAAGQVARLQVNCCTSIRMPLYAEILANLAKAQRTLTRVLHQ